MSEKPSFFLAQDVYNNWYCIPESEKETWNRLISKKDVFNYDAWDSIKEYKIDINKLTFENPICR